MRHPDEETLLDYAGGQLDLPLRLVVESHLEFCEPCRRTAGELAEPGGWQLELAKSAARTASWSPAPPRSTQIPPPCASTARRQEARPSPLPRIADAPADLRSRGRDSADLDSPSRGLGARQWIPAPRQRPGRFVPCRIGKGALPGGVPGPLRQPLPTRARAPRLGRDLRPRPRPCPARAPRRFAAPAVTSLSPRPKYAVAAGS